MHVYKFDMSATLLLKQRHALIQQQLHADGRVLALDLARQLDVSEDTIRRDLREMAAAGRASACTAAPCRWRPMAAA